MVSFLGVLGQNYIKFCFLLWFYKFYSYHPAPLNSPTVLREDDKSLRAELCNYLHSTNTIALSDPNILVRILLSVNMFGT